MSTYKEAMDRLCKRGISITTPPETGPIHPELYFEPPCSIAATIALSHPFRIGAFSHLNGGYIKDVTIGRYCSFARDIQIGHGSHPVDWLSVSPLQYFPDYRGWSHFAAKQVGGKKHIATSEFIWSAHTIIGNDVWLGNHVVIKDGMTIGDGAIVGAGSIVTRDIPPYSIAMGAPARVVRMRFPESVIKRLLQVQWWRYKMADFGVMDFSDIGKALSHIEALVAEARISEYYPDMVTYPDLFN